LFAFVGLKLGTTAVKLLPVRAELISGVVLIFIALTFVVQDLF
jgi:putative Mn2+ efflux pump MntP